MFEFFKGKGGGGGGVKFEIVGRGLGEGIVFLGGRGQLWRELHFYYYCVKTNLYSYVWRKVIY